MHFKQISSLLLLAWPMLSLGNDGENYSVATGFKRILPLTQATYKTTISINSAQQIAFEKLKETSTLENYSAATGFKRSVSSTASSISNHQAVPVQTGGLQSKTIKDSSPSVPEKRKKRIAKKKTYTL
ncbi:MAG TPA: hypothetical protein PLD88_00585, partial [Candidatus Berkiella sp.]|nr:hypothetical protein [Candidatus Berkiella sp.]